MLGLEFDKQVEFRQAVKRVAEVSLTSQRVSTLHTDSEGKAWYQGNRDKGLFVIVTFLRQHFLLDRQDDLTFSQDTRVTQVIQLAHLLLK